MPPLDQDVVYLQYLGTSTLETEFGVYQIELGEMLIVPRGVSQRTIGSADALRWAIYYRDPVKANVEVDRPHLD
jgi:homogentisate 1,2-dioxygenase